MEAICLLLAYACSKNVKVYQMEVKSSFLNGELEEEVYIEQPKTNNRGEEKRENK
jgi:hypothetical protein